jgi:hypothetical protein
MLKTYEIMIKDGQVTWLDEEPKITSAHAIITILEDETGFEQKLLEENIISGQKAYQVIAGTNIDKERLETGIAKLGGQTAREKLELETAKDESRQEILVRKASQILAQLDGQTAKEQIEGEIAKDEEMKKILGQKASHILARLGGSQPDLQPIPRRRFQEMSDDLS